METHEKLKNLRRQKGLSQVQMGKIIGTDASNYSRKERGEVKIYDDEWKKLAKALEVSLVSIKSNGIKHPLSSENSLPTSSITYSQIPDFILETQKKYIERLEKENEKLLEENNKLKKNKK
ncbi:helix-turn-helix domain-containing protein [Chryseobacterium bernardetii]|uniref:helix-turn-helix domain-containing protein n=1 Tax=Chryseobacterium bernardetii TaxID=1241978 RepID=UPI000F4FA8EA|nr:helix-turn-helix transcriptional regulator [Chryseobacterium bernardetii]AZB35273.1 XRE family transcriptional regulator [Chryseobacterium bernardetii]